MENYEEEETEIEDEGEQEGKKEKTIEISAKKILFVVLACLITAILSNLIMIKLNHRVVLTGREYMKLRTFYDDNSKIRTIEDYIDDNYLRDVDRDKMVDGKLKGMVRSLEDPYSQYLTKEEFDSIMEDTSGSFGGIGVVVSPGEDNTITVVSPMEGTPGERAGIRTGDKILAVDGQEFTGEQMEEAVKVMKGEPGTDVKLTIYRTSKSNSGERIEMNITREEIRVETVVASMLEDDIGYINLVSFDDLTHDDFVEELDGLEKQGIKGLIIDVRNNPGGLLNITADIADEFLDKGTIVYTEDKLGEREYLKSNAKMREYPIVVLVNEASASASEILAGAIKDRDRGKIVGTTTFGKGVVQRLQDFSDGSGIKLTISEYFTPNGTKIHDVGVKPDVEVENPEDLMGIGPDVLNKDLQLQKGIEVLKEDMNK